MSPVRRLSVLRLSARHVGGRAPAGRAGSSSVRVAALVALSVAALLAGDGVGAFPALGGEPGSGQVDAPRTVLPAGGMASSADRGVPGVTGVPHLRPTLDPPAPGTLVGYRWPIAKGRLTGDFGPARGASWVVDGARFHDGIDIASYCGAPILAAHDGRVLAAGRRYDRWIGWVGDVTPYEEFLTRTGSWFTLPITVVVDDGNGYRSIYTHLSRAIVRRGETVAAGDVIGYEGATGHASGCHLHYGLFSPLERRTFSFRRDLAARSQLPGKEIARVDPFEVLPPLPPSIRLGWGVTPRPAPAIPAARPE